MSPSGPARTLPQLKSLLEVAVKLNKYDNIVVKISLTWLYSITVKNAKF